MATVSTGIRASGSKTVLAKSGRLPFMLALRFSALVKAFTKASQTAAAESGGVALEPGVNRDSALVIPEFPQPCRLA